MEEGCILRLMIRCLAVVLVGKGDGAREGGRRLERGMILSGQGMGHRGGVGGGFLGEEVEGWVDLLEEGLAEISFECFNGTKRESNDWHGGC